jgi:pantothenate kinase
VNVVPLSPPPQARKIAAVEAAIKNDRNLFFIGSFRWERRDTKQTTTLVYEIGPNSQHALDGPNCVSATAH